MQENNAKYGFKNWNTCVFNKEITNVIHSLREKSTDGVFGKFEHVIMANDWQCFMNQSNQTNSNESNDTLVYSTIKWQYNDDDKLCLGPSSDSILSPESFRSCDQVSCI